MEYLHKKFNLSNQQIKDIINYLDDFDVSKYDLNNNKIKIKLILEELLLNLQNFYGDNKFVSFKVYEKNNKLIFNIYYEGEKFNPIKYDNNSVEINVIGYLDLEPTYNYLNYNNSINITIKKENKLSSATILLIFIIFGIFVGIITKNLPLDIKNNILYILDLFSSKILTLITMFSIPVVFCSIAYSITNFGNLSDFSNNGKITFLSFFSINVILEICLIILLLIFFPLKFTSQNIILNNNFDIFDNIINMFPQNIIGAFLDGNCMHVFILSVLIGIAILINKSNCKTLILLLEQSKILSLKIFDFISCFIPFLISLIIAKNIIYETLNSEVIKIWKVISITVLIIIFYIIYQVINVKKITKFKYKQIIKYILPPMLIAFMTASSFCAYQKMMDTLLNKFKIDKKYVDFNVPFSISVYKITCLFISSVIYYFSYISNHQISFSWIIIFLLLI